MLDIITSRISVYNSFWLGLVL